MQSCGMSLKAPHTAPAGSSVVSSVALIPRPSPNAACRPEERMVIRTRTFLPQHHQIRRLLTTLPSSSRCRWHLAHRHSKGKHPGLRRRRRACRRPRAAIRRAGMQPPANQIGKDVAARHPPPPPNSRLRAERQQRLAVVPQRSLRSPSPRRPKRTGWARRRRCATTRRVRRFWARSSSVCGPRSLRRHQIARSGSYAPQRRLARAPSWSARSRTLPHVPSARHAPQPSSARAPTHSTSSSARTGAMPKVRSVTRSSALLTPRRRTCGSTGPSRSSSAPRPLWRSRSRTHVLHRAAAAALLSASNSPPRTAGCASRRLSSC
mmetsp:Transcript_402/g.1030  ORF Transcript_402/g.1030 Transcript_402/m.1030 type:complete len:321 (-) Transcript_402:280-1242(-)